MTYFKGEAIEVKDSFGGVWRFRPFTPKIRNEVLKEMDLSHIKNESDIDFASDIELSERVIAKCYIDAPETVKAEFKERYGRDFTVTDIAESDVFDELAIAILPKPEKNR